MSVRLLDVVIYSFDGDKRVISLNRDGVSVITGASSTGKSALIDVIDYALGRDMCTIPEGVIRLAVQWCGVRLEGPGGDTIFIARRLPEPGISTSSEVYLEAGSEVRIPDWHQLRPVTNPDGLVSLLSDILGMPGEDSEGLVAAYPATVRHSTFFLFQRQEELVNPQALFHRQSEEFVAPVIRELIPLFLGAVSVDDFHAARRLTAQRRRVRRLEAQVREARELGSGGREKSAELLLEAVSVGLTTPGESYESSDQDELNLLRMLSERTQELIAFGGSADANTESVVAALEEERRRLEIEYGRLRERISTVGEYERAQGEFSSEVREQQARLSSLELLPEDAVGETQGGCPLCGETVSAGRLPTVQNLQESLTRLREQVATLTIRTPRRAEVELSLREELADVQRLLARNAEQHREYLQTRDSLSRTTERQARQAFVLGRIKLYVESVGQDSDLVELEQELSKARAILEELAMRLDQERIEERLEAVVARISGQMTRWSLDLSTEYAGEPHRLDVKRLTVVVEALDRLIRLNQMGSGANWVSSHVLAHLALHRHFSAERLPVPRFLVLDQPSEVYFPADSASADLKSGGLGDRDELVQLIRLIFDAASASEAPFQVLLTEHADLQEEWYQARVIERWRDGEALVPESWL